MSSTVLENMEIHGSSIAVRFRGGFSRVFFSVAGMSTMVSKTYVSCCQSGPAKFHVENMCVLVRQRK